MRTAIAFVDDADFFISGHDAACRTQEILHKYNTLHAASGGKGQMDKNIFYFWKTYLDQNGNLVFENIPTTIYVNCTEIKQLSITTPIRSLGVITTPCNDWTHQYGMMRNKMESAVKQLQHAILHPSEVKLFFYEYLIKSVFFGAGIINLTNRQQI